MHTIGKQYENRTYSLTVFQKLIQKNIKLLPSSGHKDISNVPDVPINQQPIPLLTVECQECI